jgi:hypothetical protein
MSCLPDPNRQLRLPSSSSISLTRCRVALTPHRSMRTAPAGQHGGCRGCVRRGPDAMAGCSHLAHNGATLKGTRRPERIPDETRSRESCVAAPPLGPGVGKDLGVRVPPLAPLLTSRAFGELSLSALVRIHQLVRLRHQLCSALRPLGIDLGEAEGNSKSIGPARQSIRC